ncbi:malto-oligosyltrehalose synthase [Pigmentiphaga aceris]|uniref:Malto-oligosyltrehalose synthase n=1 Tax=Pigmentiphaga aceris TaxID=1940612 RepID=A0A5C0B260_9BURK|nr:malto-oligosyltrehalose synthase [Pigmentiphaga aceris]QEI07994.1 malto-oligosyltrehalose synthase [Pigmentiphaga aceris]
MSLLRATARFQFHADFPIDAAVPLVDYYARLGVSHFYASPLTRARKGSTHGYDTIDYSLISPELGGEPALHRLVTSLREAGMGLILDIVPNHMASGPETAWWQSMLEWGPHSPYASYFDVDWQADDPWLHGKVLAPFLGEQLGKVLDSGTLHLRFDADTGQFYLAYHETRYPLTPGSFGTILRAGVPLLDEATLAMAAFFDDLAGEDVTAAQREQAREVLKLAAQTPAGKQAINDALAAHDPLQVAGRQHLDSLLDKQHYRLAWWRTAPETINWRRFFEITDLAGLRVEQEEVFEAVHELVFRLYAEGWIDGVRIDHIDGLSDPLAYSRKLRARLEALQSQRPGRLAQDAPVILVEKILAADETLDPRWGVDGTTGYEFMDQVGALLHDPSGEARLTALWQRVSGSTLRFDEHVINARRLLIAQHFAGEVEAVARVLQSIARMHPESRDWSLVAIRRVLSELLLHVPVYRTYVDLDGRSETDQAVFDRAADAARANLRGTDIELLKVLDGWLGGDAPQDFPPPECEQRLYVARRFQQLTSPLAAKSVEDTAFFRYGRLLSRNEVGADPGQFSLSVADFHQCNAERLATTPNAMLATATHDHKRGEDARARLAVLSNQPAQWAQTIERWLARDAAAAAKHGEVALDAPDAYLLYQTIVASWPLSLRLDDGPALQAFAERLIAWQQKALREAKQRSTWFDPDSDYEAAGARFLTRLFDPVQGADALADILTYVESIATAGAVNSLVQTVLKLTVPGVPDIYQGTDWWDLSLMDPDNRRPVDFTARRAAESMPAEVDELWADWPSGRVKHHTISRILGLRRRLPALFASGDYVPLEIIGAAKHHALAFARVDAQASMLVVVPLYMADRLDSSGVASTLDWADTCVILPDALEGRRFESVTASGSIAPLDGRVRVADAVFGLPFAVLVAN